MSKKDNVVKVEVANEAVETKTVEVVSTRTKDQVYSELDALVKQRNNSASVKIRDDIDSKIDELVKEYTGIAETECFDEISKAKNPMLAAAQKLTFTTVKVSNDSELSTEKHIVQKIDSDVRKTIDPLRLQKKIGKIGADENWAAMIEVLNRNLTGGRAAQLGLNVKDVMDSYALSDAAKKLSKDIFKFDPCKYENSTANDLIKQDLQTMVDAMIGKVKIGKVEMKVCDYLVNYVLMIYQKKNTKRALSITTANFQNFRKYILEVCYKIATNADFSINYKVAK